jgi:hypothetical protein
MDAASVLLPEMRKEGEATMAKGVFSPKNRVV